MRSLIVGMGFGNAVYKPILAELGHEIVTVDPVRPADFLSVEEAIDKHRFFSIAHITTPNYTHEPLARLCAPYSRFVFVEKPGVKDRNSWLNLIKDHPNIVMTKNNQYRDEIDYFRNLARQSKHITIKWSNNNRIPNPGSWFTDRKLSFGGVSRDLMPHLLSYYTLFGSYERGKRTKRIFRQDWKLEDLKSTDYGNINHNGIFDVDTYFELEYETAKTKWTLIADWRSDFGIDEIYIDFDGKRFELGLCPEKAYRRMIETAIDNRDRIWYWEDQLAQDLFIHQEIEIE